MMTLRQFAEPLQSVPAATSWYLADLGQAVGKQELFTKQSPQKLKVLREHALIESAVSSNRIEGVEVDQARVGTIVFGKAPLRDRDEEEVRGYRQALDLIHTSGADLPVSEETIRRLHALSRGGIGDAGEYKQSENDIIEVFADGRREIRFRTVRAADVLGSMAELVAGFARFLLTSSERVKWPARVEARLPAGGSCGVRVLPPSKGISEGRMIPKECKRLAEVVSKHSATIRLTGNVQRLQGFVGWLFSSGMPGGDGRSHPARSRIPWQMAGTQKNDALGHLSDSYGPLLASEPRSKLWQAGQASSELTPHASSRSDPASTP